MSGGDLCCSFSSRTVWQCCILGGYVITCPQASVAVSECPCGFVFAHMLSECLNYLERNERSILSNLEIFLTPLLSLPSSNHPFIHLSVWTSAHLSIQWECSLSNLICLLPSWALRTSCLRLSSSLGKNQTHQSQIHRSLIVCLGFWDIQRIK